MVRFHWMAAFLLAASLSIIGCSDDSGSSAGDVGQDVGNDTQPDTQPDGGLCGDRTECRGNADCDAATEFCNAGCCDLRVVEETCTAQDQACADDTWSNDNYVCDSGLNLCLARCDSDTTDVSEPDACSRGGWCFELNDPGEADLDGVCLTGDCNDACFDPAVCPSETPYTCDSGDGSGTCFAFGNNASFCLPAGDVVAGAACVSGSDDAAEICADGLFCFNSECVVPCSGDGECSDGDTCVAIFDQSGDNEPGLCGEECAEFSSGDCSDDDYHCAIQVGNFTGDVTTFFCVEPTSTTIVANGEACDPDGVDNACAEGNACVIQFEGNDLGTCQQLCDSTLEVDAALAACPVGDPTSIFVDESDNDVFFAYLETTPDTAVAAGDGQDLQVVLAPETEGGDRTIAAVLNGADLADGTSYSVPAFLGGGGAALDAFEDFNDATPDLSAGAAGLRGYNVSSVDMDLYRVEPLLEAFMEPGDIDRWTSLAFGDSGTNLYTVYETTTDGGFVFDHIATADEPATPIVEGVIFTETGDGDELVYTTLFETALPADLDTTGAAVRVVNASVTNATIDIDFPPGGTGDEDVADLAYGDITAEAAGDWFVVPIPVEVNDVDFDVTITFGEAGTLTHPITDVGRGDVITLVFWDGTDATAAVIEALYSPTGDSIAPDGDDDITLQLIDASGADVMLAREADDSLGTFASGATLPAGDGGIEVDPGTFVVALRPASGATTEAPAQVSGDPITLAEDDWAQLWVWDLEDEGETDGGQDLLFIDYTPADLDAIGADESALRFVHLVDGAGDATLQFRGEALQICAPLTVEGLGRCSDRCEPFMGGVPFVDGEGDPNERWLTNGCLHDDDVEYSCLPFTTTGNEDVPVELDGPPDIGAFCAPRAVPDAGWNGFGDECTTTGDASCNPDAFCVGVGEGRAECTKLCLPFSGVDHSDCQYTIGQDGALTDVESLCQAAIVPQSFGFCLEPDLPALREGDDCTEEQGGDTCGDDDTLCISTPNEGYRCRRVCKKEIDETCPDLVDGTAMVCRPDLAFQPPIPDFISVCGPAG